jgi:hypothetical protein
MQKNRVTTKDVRLHSKKSFIPETQGERMPTTLALLQVSGTMIRGTQIINKTFSSTETKQGHSWAIIRLARGRLDKQPSTGKFSASPEAPIQGLGREKFSDSPDLSL